MSDLTSSRGGTMTCMGCRWCQAQVMLEGPQLAKKNPQKNKTKPNPKHNPDKKWILRKESQLGTIALPTYKA